MKMKPEHFEHMKAVIQKFLGNDTKEIVEKYETGNFARADRVRDLSLRFRWDVFASAGLTRFACESLYDYLNDDHIDTALRQILPTLQRRY